MSHLQYNLGETSCHLPTGQTQRRIPPQKAPLKHSGVQALSKLERPLWGQSTPNSNRADGTQTKVATKVVFNLIAEAKGLEIPLPNDYTALISPPVTSVLPGETVQKNSTQQRVKHFYKWLHSTIHQKLAKLFPILSVYKVPQTDLTLSSCIQSLLNKNAIKMVENTKPLGSS